MLRERDLLGQRIGVEQGGAGMSGDGGSRIGRDQPQLGLGLGQRRFHVQPGLQGGRVVPELLRLGAEPVAGDERVKHSGVHTSG